ncbi:aminoimidazole riboside kinase [Serratia fonticola]|uniref:aminoimidazole riboside kinase n=1 Tax=Serratia fonticola TaxID=47917 RepID=UPI000BFD7EC4|nr:aminoimidazole riboside kinase [Serratia fonticola]ATM74634.1 aminoimidazole riboside kinase [Serratia fonticola]
MKLWTVGDAVIDLLPQPDMQYKACAGGAPLNVAVGAARLGCDCGFIGRVGDDPFGHFLQQTLYSEGVETQHIQFDEQYHTSTVLVALGNDGDRSFTFLVNPSADQFLSSKNLPDFDDDILHFCSLALVAKQSRETLVKAISLIKQRGGILSFDVNLREKIWGNPQEMLATVTEFAHQSDILKLSEEELYWITGTTHYEKALERVKRFPSSLKIVTRGIQGAIALWQDLVIHVDSYKVNSLDTTGAGDAFIAGLLANISLGNGLLDFEQLKLALTQASACGALATTQKGALSALPDAEGVRSFIGSEHRLTFKVNSLNPHE